MGSNPTFSEALLMLFFRLGLRKIFLQNQYIGVLLVLILNWLFVLLKIVRLEKKESDLEVLNED